MIFDSKLEGWPSGLRRTLGKRVEGNTSPGFESPSLRHIVTIITNQLIEYSCFFVSRVCSVKFLLLKPSAAKTLWASSHFTLGLIA